MVGSVTLFGSGETTPVGGKVFESLVSRRPPRVRIGIVETPAGFEVNSERVAGRVKDFLAKRLQNYLPDLVQIPARRQGTHFSPDDPEVVQPLMTCDLVFLGPGSPTYAVRQLRGSLAWSVIQARHRLGASLVLASAASIASGSQALPVYEIYKVGEDLHWKPGLDLWSPYGLDLAVVPHWNNTEGGAELDTSRCFMGRERFKELCGLLPRSTTILGIDEKTALTLDIDAGACTVRGIGKVTWIRDGVTDSCGPGVRFPITELGPYENITDPGKDIPAAVWKLVMDAESEKQVARNAAAIHAEIPPEVQDLVQRRSVARATGNWTEADNLRVQLSEQGWQVLDSPQGPRVIPLRSHSGKASGD